MFKKTILPLLVFLSFSVSPQETVYLMSWSIKDFGKTKGSEELEGTAELVGGTGILAIQEAVAGYGGLKLYIIRKLFIF